MALVVFPDTLPGPSLSRVVPGERRIPSDLSGGPQQFRGIQRDYSAVHEVEWSLLSPTEAAIFDDWWRNTLKQGGAWFASGWPAVQGYGNLVRRFSGAPSWTLLEGGYWKVGAKLIVRGRTMPPVDCFIETFSSGLSSYSILNGSTLPFTITTSPRIALRTTRQSAAYNNSRIFTEIDPRTLSFISVDFLLRSIGTDDSGTMQMFQGGTQKFAVQPMREAFYDPLKRPHVYYGDSAIPVGPGALSVGVVYHAEVMFSTSGNDLCELYEEASGALVQSTDLGAHASMSVDRLTWNVDDAPRLCETDFYSARIC